MTIIKPYAKLNRKIRHLRKMEKIYRNEAKAYRDEAAYHQAVIDNIAEKFNLAFDF